MITLSNSSDSMLHGHFMRPNTLLGWHTEDIRRSFTHMVIPFNRLLLMETAFSSNFRIFVSSMGICHSSHVALIVHSGIPQKSLPIWSRYWLKIKSDLTIAIKMIMLLLLVALIISKMSHFIFGHSSEYINFIWCCLWTDCSNLIVILVNYFQYVNNVIIDAPYEVPASLLDHFKVSFLLVSFCDLFWAGIFYCAQLLG